MDDDYIVNSSRVVYQEMGAGMREKVYQNALNILLSEEYRTVLEYPISIEFRGHCVSLCYPDILLFNNKEKIILEIKCISKLQLKEHLQIQGYLRHTGINQGYLINFGLRELEVVKYDGLEQTNLTDDAF